MDAVNTEGRRHRPANSSFEVPVWHLNWDECFPVWFFIISEREGELRMPEKLAAGLGRKAFAFDEGIVGNGGAECFAPTETFLHGLASGGNGHGVEPPALLGS